MEAVTVETRDDRFLISIDRSYINQAVLMRLVERIKVEHLVEKADFDESIEELGEEIKANWWADNRARFLGHGA